MRGDKTLKRLWSKLNEETQKENLSKDDIQRICNKLGDLLGLNNKFWFLRENHMFEPNRAAYYRNVLTSDKPTEPTTSNEAVDEFWKILCCSETNTQD